MKTKLPHREVPDTYLQMILQFPLRPLRNDRELAKATAILDRWLVRDDLDRGRDDYLRVLADLVAGYEERRHPVGTPPSTPLQRLQYLVAESGTTPSGLAKILGCSASLASLILHGKRGLSKANIRKLAEHFRMEPGYFLA